MFILLGAGLVALGIGIIRRDWRNDPAAIPVGLAFIGIGITVGCIDAGVEFFRALAMTVAAVILFDGIFNGVKYLRRKYIEFKETPRVNWHEGR